MVLSMALISMALAILALAAIVFAILSQWLTLFAYLDAAILLLMLHLIVFTIPLHLNWSRNLYKDVFWGVAVYSIFGVVVYAGLYYASGLITDNEEPVRLVDYVYFSLSMWTALGYNEFTPPPNMRLLSALEAVNGLLTLPVLAAVIWLYCSFKIRDVAEERQALMSKDGRIVLDYEQGVWIDEPSDKVREADAKRTHSHALNPCGNCGSTNLTLPRYWEVMNWFTPFPVFAVKCSNCGNVSKPSRNVYLAAWRWNRLNPICEDSKGDTPD